MFTCKSAKVYARLGKLLRECYDGRTLGNVELAHHLLVYSQYVARHFSQEIDDASKRQDNVLAESIFQAGEDAPASRPRGRRLKILCKIVSQDVQMLAKMSKQNKKNAKIEKVSFARTRAPEMEANEAVQQKPSATTPSRADSFASARAAGVTQKTLPPHQGRSKKRRRVRENVYVEAWDEKFPCFANHVPDQHPIIGECNYHSELTPADGMWKISPTHMHMIHAAYAKYSGLVWMARGPMKLDWVRELERRYPTETRNLSGRESSWHHGFHSGVAAATAMFMDLCLRDVPSVQAIESGQPALPVPDGFHESNDLWNVNFAVDSFPVLDI